MTAEPLYAFSVVLAVEFILIDARAESGQPAAKLRHNIGQKGRLIVGDKSEIIHESFVHYSHGFQPFVYFVEVVI